MIADRTISEPARETPVADETEVIIAGGGVAGFTAAIASARTGAKSLLIERYGCLGGLATGGLVLHMMALFGRQQRRWGGGLAWECLQRVDAAGGLTHEAPTRPHVDSEVLKVVADEMCAEAGVSVFCHAWVTDVICEQGRVTGVIAESKAGRQAFLARVCVDATGDGDVAVKAGARWEKGRLRIGLPVKLCGIDMETHRQFAAEQPAELQRLYAEIERRGGFRIRPRPTPYTGVGVCWSNIRGLLEGPGGRSIDPLDPRDLSWTERELRRRVLESLEFHRRHVPGFERAGVAAFAWQLGVRDSRRIVGRHWLTAAEVDAPTEFEDSIGCAGLGEKEVDHHQIPFRCLIPDGLGGLLTAGRCISVDERVVQSVRLIPPCMVTGQAAGTAAAIAAAAGLDPADLPATELRQQLAGDGVILG